MFSKAGEPVRQEGAVLIISLVMLLVITILGVGALESSLLQQRMAVNAQNKNQAFQDTASILENILRDETVVGRGGKVLDDAESRGQGILGSPVNYIRSGNVSAEYTVTYMGEKYFRGEGEEVSFDNETGTHNVYEIRLATQNDITGTRATHIQGFHPY